MFPITKRQEFLLSLLTLHWQGGMELQRKLEEAVGRTLVIGTFYSDIGILEQLCFAERRLIEPPDSQKRLRGGHPIAEFRLTNDGLHQQARYSEKEKGSLTPMVPEQAS